MSRHNTVPAFSLDLAIEQSKREQPKLANVPAPKVDAFAEYKREMEAKLVQEQERSRLLAEKVELMKTQGHPVKLSLKVGEKGGLSCYGLGRWPVTLYKSQWLALLSFAENIRAFIKAHPELKEKE